MTSSRSITDHFKPGTRAESMSITDVAPDVHIYGETPEEYEAWVQQVKEDSSMSPKEQATHIASVPAPAETYAERIRRAD